MILKAKQEEEGSPGTPRSRQTSSINRDRARGMAGRAELKFDIGLGLCGAVNLGNSWE